MTPWLDVDLGPLSRVGVDQTNDFRLWNFWKSPLQAWDMVVLVWTLKIGENLLTVTLLNLYIASACQTNNIVDEDLCIFFKLWELSQSLISLLKLCLGGKLEENSRKTPGCSWWKFCKYVYPLKVKIWSYFTPPPKKKQKNQGEHELIMWQVIVGSQCSKQTRGCNQDQEKDKNPYVERWHPWHNLNKIRLLSLIIKATRPGVDRVKPEILNWDTT